MATYVSNGPSSSRLPQTYNGGTLPSSSTFPRSDGLHSSNSDLNPGATPTQASVSALATAPPVPRAALVPTNSVTTKDGQVVRARIDPQLAVDDVIRQLCLNLKIQDPPVLYALRDDADELVTDDNLRRMIKGRVPLK